MSMNMGGDGGSVSYADHDVHHIQHQVFNIAGSGGDDVTATDVKEFEITERGLDPDELAELRAMRVAVGCIARAGEGQDSRGEFHFSVDAGYNIGAGDAVTLVSVSDDDSFDPDDDGTDEVRGLTRETDEVGQIYSLADTFTISYDDDTNGNGGIGGSQTTTEMLNMADLFGSGPFVDSADDFVSVVEARPENVIEDFGVDIRYSLYYDVNVTEGGRSRFGR